MDKAVIGWLALTGYAIVTVGLTVRGARRSRSVASYAVGNRDLPAAVVGLSLAAQLTSVATFVINPGLVHAFGLSALLGYGVCAALGITLGLVFFSRRFRTQGARVQALTIPQWIGARYDSPGLRALFALLSLGLVTFAVLIVVALALVVASLLSLPVKAVALGLVVFAFGGVMLGGATAHAWTNAVQASIMLLVALLLIVGGAPTFPGDGLLARLRAIDPLLAAPVNPSSPYFRNAFETFACNFLVGLAIVCQPHILSKALYLRDDRQVRRYLATALGCGLVFTAVLVVGLWARLTLAAPVRIDRVVPTWIAQTFSPGEQVLIAVGLLCAGLSTLEGILLALSSIFAVDLLPMLRRGAPASDRAALAFGRAGLLAVAVAVSLLAAWQIDSPTGGSVAIFAQYGVYLLFTVSFLPLACGMLLPSVGRGAVTAGAVAALLGYLLTAFFRPTPLANNPAVLATVGMLAGAAVVAAAAAKRARPRPNPGSA